MRHIAIAVGIALAIAGCSAGAGSEASPVFESHSPDGGGAGGSQRPQEEPDADLSGYAPSSAHERRIAALTDSVDSAEALAALQLEAARTAGANTLEPTTINRVAADACLSVMVGATDIDGAYENAVASYSVAGDPAGSPARSDIAASLSVAGYYCPQLWDEFQAWTAPEMAAVTA